MVTGSLWVASAAHVGYLLQVSSFLILHFSFLIHAPRYSLHMTTFFSAPRSESSKAS